MHNDLVRDADVVHMPLPLSLDIVLALATDSLA